MDFIQIITGVAIAAIVLFFVFVMLQFRSIKEEVSMAANPAELNITFDPQTIPIKNIEYHIARLTNAKLYTEKPAKLAEIDAWLDYFNNLLAERTA